MTNPFELIEVKLSNIETLLLDLKFPPTPSIEQAKDKPMSIDDLVKYTGYSKGYIYKGTSAREIPHTKPRNGKLCFWKAEIDEWLKSGRRSTKAEISEAVNNQLSGQ